MGFTVLRATGSPGCEGDPFMCLHKDSPAQRWVREEAPCPATLHAVMAPTSFPSHPGPTKGVADLECHRSEGDGSD